MCHNNINPWIDLIACRNLILLEDCPSSLRPLGGVTSCKHPTVLRQHALRLLRVGWTVSASRCSLPVLCFSLLECTRQPRRALQLQDMKESTGKRPRTRGKMSGCNQSDWSSSNSVRVYTAVSACCCCFHATVWMFTRREKVLGDNVTQQMLAWAHTLNGFVACESVSSCSAVGIMKKTHNSSSKMLIYSRGGPEEGYLSGSNLSPCPLLMIDSSFNSFFRQKYKTFVFLRSKKIMLSFVLYDAKFASMKTIVSWSPKCHNDPL